MNRRIEISEQKIGRRAPEFLNLAELKHRGWTELLIRLFAGPADHRQSTSSRAGPAMRLYQAVRIQEIEASPPFVEAREIADRRRTAAKKGLQTKTQKAAASAAENIALLVLPPASRTELEAAAIVWHSRRDIHGSAPAS